jgi:hypothetical protein
MATINSTINSSTSQSSQLKRLGYRPREHGCAALRLLERLRKAARECETPSTADLQAEHVYGLRPVNRIGDLIRGRYNGMRYDIERLDCEHGVYRWRLHEPARPGYPKNKRQEVLPLGHNWYEAQTGKKRLRWQPRPSSEKRMAQDDCFVLTPPEPHQ